MADNGVEIAVEIDDSSEAIKHTQPRMRFTAPIPSTLGELFAVVCSPLHRRVLDIQIFHCVP